MVCAVCLYLVGFYALLAPATRVTGEILVVGITLLHLFELKTALRIARARGISMARSILMNMAFGFTWWFPLHNSTNK